ncbi:MAG: hypothetical protein ACOY3M_00950 [Patescibacteria group bacterium]
MKKASAKKHPVPVPPQFESAPVNSPKVKHFSWQWILVGLFVLLGVLVAVNKGWVVAAVVDGRPIFAWQLNSTLRTRYGQQTLEGMIGEALIKREAEKNGVVVTKEDITKKQNEILSSLGTEVSLEDFLKFQGMTEADFNSQLVIQLTVERLLTKDRVVSEADIDNFIATSAATLSATEPAALREEAKNAIISNEISEKLQPWFLELRQKSNVMKFL